MAGRTVSTTTPLTAGSQWPAAGSLANFTLEAGLADYITGAVFADQSGTIFIEQSGDGANWDISTSYAVTANDGKGFSEQILLPYVRVRYVNDGTNQGAFRLFARMTSAGPR